jgi:hypothetical protein
MEIVNDFLFVGDYSKLSDKYKVTRNTLRDGISSFRNRLNSIYELHYMANAKKAELSTEVIEKALSTTFVSQELRDMLSDDHTELLTPQEILYCHLFVNTGSNELALKESQLDTCLKDKTPVRIQYLGMHLREKPNLKLYIQALQKEQIEEIEANKSLVQYELVKQIEQLKETLAHGGKKADRGNLIKCIELLGKTVGAYEERVRVTEVNAADALDELVEMAKKEVAKIEELPPGTEVDETWESKEQ